MKKIFYLSVCLLLICITANSDNKEPIRIACIGNSITYGSGIKDRANDSYPSLLQQYLGEDYEVRNYGYSARTMLRKGNHPYMDEKMYQEALDFLPNIVTIKLGTNDSKPGNWKYGDEFQKDIEEMIEAFQALPSKPKIYLCLPAPVFKNNFTINDSIIVNNIIPTLNQVAKDKKLEVIDLRKPLERYPEFFPDGVHPNEQGAKIIAKEVLQSLLGKKRADKCISRFKEILCPN